MNHLCACLISIEQLSLVNHWPKKAQALKPGIVVSDSEAGGEQAKYQEGLRAGLVLDIVLDWVRDEVLVLEEDLPPA